MAGGEFPDEVVNVATGLTDSVVALGISTASAMVELEDGSRFTVKVHNHDDLWAADNGGLRYEIAELAL